MPLDIIEELENTPPQQLQDNLKQFKREAHKYVPNDWTTPETINRNFLPNLKKYTVETTQIINSIYKVTENTRFQASTAVEIYEQLGYLIEHHQEVDAEEAHSLLQQTCEQAKRLAIFGRIDVTLLQSDFKIPNFLIRKSTAHNYYL
ncbi:hypothetical protein G6F57_016421 [Rhizopus arrhizus]|uniref:Uncharacterized protein n=1 Tax=Rhizopus oryzae TaxID=64495 RepID=A0A9P6WWC8_RHIOR|nr:hypothetical protein G6F30_012963 [Rhizopus arrhizus]KAG0973220.1 hypothetical protein G6F29_012976 [Rhizopus arrhizus]KAG0978686.1 hypothetical protein G6F28_012080 [Rhizopus arrhizus]KAG1001221.1 hypothetical protein G6F27_013078 [Rhizopus arrhizus]KAG1015292.1 hypothetical protein G6F26_013253 [Rhizopus arrhizus]